MRSLVWFRNDLRTTDHAALSAAASRGEVIACYCESTAQWREHDMGDMRLAFQLRTLHALAADLKKLNIPLRIVSAPSFADCPTALESLCRELDITHVDYIAEYPFNERRRDQQVSQRVRSVGVTVTEHVGDVVLPPGSLLTGDGRPYTVFSPFYKKWLPAAERNFTHSLSPPDKQAKSKVASDALPKSWDGVDVKLGKADWPAGEWVAIGRLQDFVDEFIQDYSQQRDIPAIDGTSRLSAHLAVGAISARQCAAGARRREVSAAAAAEGAGKWIAEIAWRDFYRHIVAQFDHVNFGANFRQDMHLPWRQAPDELAAWQVGETGYPIVDAAMRQLNATGWMHNRLRMVTAMFLTKHLLIDWREGERYFMRHLVDGDFASNNGGWQWSASTGTDAAPYFRIFNPATQGQRFDAGGEFTKRMVPQLRDVPPKQLFEREKYAPVRGYPEPIVKHAEARARALDFFKANL